VELGQHIAQVCRGCHGPHLSGGKLDGDPDMPLVANITPHETGLKSWSEGDFIRALREGKRKDGTAINKAMPWQAYGQMSDTELKAVWAYLQTVPPLEKGNH
jgi:cytochrome c553